VSHVPPNESPSAASVAQTLDESFVPGITKREDNALASTPTFSTTAKADATYPRRLAHVGPDILSLCGAMALSGRTRPRFAKRMCSSSACRLASERAFANSGEQHRSLARHRHGFFV